jgi:bifunctional DNA-binding transcriptional regulator/antitoxin component of YhaV-PrlF toxin-antitoxin module
MTSEIVVGKRGRITIPVWVRKKYDVEGRVKIIETEEGIMMLPKTSLWELFWDMIESNSEPVAGDNR